MEIMEFMGKWQGFSDDSAGKGGELTSALSLPIAVVIAVRDRTKTRGYHYLSKEL